MASATRWRVYVNETVTTDAPWAISEIEFRESVGVSQQATGGSYISSSIDQADLNLVFDGSVGDDVFYTDYSLPQDRVPQWIEYQFATAKTIVEVMLGASNFGDEDYMPSDFVIQYYNGVSWVDAGVFPSEAAWSSNETRVYAVSAGAPSETGIVTATFQNVLNYRTGTVLARFTNNLFTVGQVSAQFQNEITYNTDVVTATFENNLYDSSPITATFENRLQSTAAASSWQLSVLLDGVDMSARLSGDVSVTMEEGAARVADFELMPFSGVIDPYSWIGVSVVIEYIELDSGGVELRKNRLFTGEVDLPTYDPLTRFTSFSCTDALQAYFEQNEFADIDLAIGGYYSSVIFSKTDDKWQYAQQRISTQAASFEFDAFNNLVKTDWQPKAVADISFDASDINHQSLALSLATRRDIVNTINVNFNYRFARKWQREISGLWNYPSPFYIYLTDGTTLPNRSMILSALNSGWSIKSISWVNVPPNGTYQNNAGKSVSYGVSDELRDSLVWGVNFSLAKRWLQDVTESYSIAVTCDASVQKHGVIDVDETYSLDEVVDEDFEETSEADTGNLLSTGRTISGETSTGAGYKSKEAGGTQINNYDYIIDPAIRTEFDNASKTAIAEAKTHILKTHRNNKVSIKTLLDPLVDLTKTAEITTNEVTAKGKVRFVEHVLNTDTGEAITSIEVAVYQPNIDSQADDAVSVPALADSSVSVSPSGLLLGTYFGGKSSSQPYDPSWTGYIGNYSASEVPSEIYPLEFRVDIPAVEDAARNELTATAISTINTAIPQDNLIINV